jgi:hypothetical protein
MLPMKLAGRCANGFERDRGTVYHAVPEEASNSGWGTALCGKEPGRRSVGWAHREGTEVSCPRCLKKLRAVAPSQA